MCDCLKSYGETLTDNRTVSAFTTLDVFDKIDVYYIQDTTSNSYSVQVVTGKHLLSNVSTVVTNGVLQIKNNNKCNFVRGSHNEVTVYITAPYIESFIQDGVGTVYSANTINSFITMKQDSLNYSIQNSGDIHLNLNIHSIKGSMYGVGDIYLTGNVHNHNVNAAGECFVNAQNLQTAYTFIVYNSTGQAYVNITAGGELDAIVGYEGDIYYSGNPSTVKKSGNGSGEIIKN